MADTVADAVRAAQVSQATGRSRLEKAEVADAMVLPAWVEHVRVFEGHQCGDLFFREAKTDGLVELDHRAKLLEVRLKPNLNSLQATFKSSENHIKMNEKRFEARLKPDLKSLQATLKSPEAHFKMNEERSDVRFNQKPLGNTSLRPLE